VLQRAPAQKHWLVLAGRTGSGKTQLLKRTAVSIDLEGLANHRGSAFGAQTTPQPSLIGFENQLAVTFLQHESELLLLEDESRTIGRIGLPQAWHEQMQRSALLILEADLATRCANITREYVTEPLAAGIAEEALLARFTSALNRIQRRLGGERHRTISAQLQRSFASGDHSPWIEQLLCWYYDPMYDYQLSRKKDRVIGSGDAQALLAFLADYRVR
jgi:tRNA 2-selenouridine synthase